MIRFSWDLLSIATRIAIRPIPAVAPPIAAHPDALAVWEYLDRSVDPTIVGRAFELPQN